MQFTYKGISVQIPDGRLEVCRLKAKFDDFASGMSDEVMKSFDEKFENMRAFLLDGDEWAHGFIDRGADMVVRELGNLDCYDMDREGWIEKYIDYSSWDASTKPYREMVEELDAQEAAKEEQRAARTEALGNTFSEHKVSIQSDDEGNAEMRDGLDGDNIVANLGLSAASGIFNMIGRGMSKSAIEKELKESFESTEFRMGIERGILDSIANAYVNFMNYCIKTGIKNDFLPITQEEIDKSNRLANNIERGLIPAEKLDAMIANALVADPHNERIYQMLLVKGEDKDGTLSKIADFFHFHKLNSLKKAAFLKECGDPTITFDENLAKELKELGEVVITSEAEYVAYREKYVKVAQDLQLPETDLSQMLAKLEQEYAKARQEYGKNQIASLFKSLPTDTEEKAIHAKEEIVSCMKEYGLTSCNELESIEEKIQKFDLEYRTVDKTVFSTREEADLQRKLLSFFQSLPTDTEEKTIESKQKLLEEAERLSVSPDWLVPRIDKCLQHFDYLARLTFGIEYPTREEAKNALSSLDAFLTGIKKLVTTDINCSFSQNQLTNARTKMELPEEIEIYGIVDMTLLKTGQNALCITQNGLYWTQAEVSLGQEIAGTKLGKNAMGTLAKFGFGKKLVDKIQSKDNPTGASKLFWNDMRTLPSPVYNEQNKSFVFNDQVKIPVSNSQKEMLGKIISTIQQYCQAAKCFS